MLCARKEANSDVWFCCVDFPDLYSSYREELLLALHNFATSLMEWAEDEGPGMLLAKIKKIQRASQGTDSAIAALEAGECIDTDDEGPGRTSAAISPTCLLSV